MDETLTPIVQRIEKEFGVKASEPGGEVSLTIPAEAVVPACGLVHTLGFEQLSTMTAVDYWPNADPRFQVVYLFTSLSLHQVLRFRVNVPGINPPLASITSVYRNADWRERELWDMFGIKFTGHPDLRRILMPADWEGHPLRKDYPLGYEEPQFTFNYEQIKLRKPYAKE